MEYSVYNKGIIHGLSSIPNTEDNLTALVTGATGLSGYHLVKVLASSSSRWSKIYCLSSRSPPESFWNDLGDAAARVEHVAVDFLEEPDKIAHALGGKAMLVNHKEQINGSLSPTLTDFPQRLCLLLLLQAASSRGRCSQSLG